MKTYFLFIPLIWILMFTGCTTYKEARSPQVMKIAWDILDRNVEGSGKTRAKMILTNTSTDVLTREGWAVYFNSGDIQVLEADRHIVRIDTVNGDVFTLYPATDWTDLPPDSSRVVTVLCRKVKNFTDLPKGFYLVSKKYPDGVDISFTCKVPSDIDSLEWDLAIQQYVQNAVVSDLPRDTLPPVFPSPKQYSYDNTSFVLDATCTIITEEEFAQEALFLQSELRGIMKSAPTMSDKTATKQIIFKKKDIAHHEGYELTVDDTQIVVEAATANGAFYAVQSLLNMVPKEAWKNKQSTIPLRGIHIVDEPRFSYRALMLDVARNFRTKDQVFRVLDLMALYKLNILHFHLNDDEGWRLEIPGLPELTDVGGKRGHVNDENRNLWPSYGSGASVDNKTGSGHYGRTEFMEILRYAHARHIQVIPEIETPGHARAAIKAMDARYARLKEEGDSIAAKAYLLRDLADKSIYRSIQNWNDNVIDVSLQSTYSFLEKVTDEIIQMYKDAGASLTTIHFGGDEVPEGVWEKSPSVQRLLASRSDLSGVDDLWHYYFGKIDDMLRSKGLFLSGWEEIGMKKAVVNGHRKMVVEPMFAHKGFRVNVWNNLGENEDLAYRLANVGYQVILTNVSNFYFDLAYSSSYHEPGQYWGGYVDIDKPFRFIPYDYYTNSMKSLAGRAMEEGDRSHLEKLSAEGRKNIVGIEAPLWSEIIDTEDRMEYLLLPKLFGLAERAWAAEPVWSTTMEKEQFREAWSSFVHVVGKKELPKLDYYNGGYLYRIPTVGVRIDAGRLYANVQMPGFTIRYSADHTDPTSDNPLFEQGMTVNKVKSLRVFNGSGRGGRTLKVR